MSPKCYRVWNVINPPSNVFRYSVDSPREAYLLINKLADQQLEDPRIICNAFGLEVFEGGEWCEWYDEDGQDVDHSEESTLEKSGIE